MAGKLLGAWTCQDNCNACLQHCSQKEVWRCSCLKAVSTFLACSWPTTCLSIMAMSCRGVGGVPMPEAGEPAAPVGV